MVLIVTDKDSDIWLTGSKYIWLYKYCLTTGSSILNSPVYFDSAIFFVDGGTSAIVNFVSVSVN